MTVKKSSFPSEEKVWNKYYRENPIRKFDIGKTLYRQIVDANSDNLDLKAVGYLGTDYTYRELLKRVNKLASAYEKAGIKEGDVVPISTINTPEAAETLLALSKLGAISKWVDLRSTDEQLIKYINEHEAKIFVGLDILMPRMEKIINETNLESVLYVSPKHGISPLKVLFSSPKAFIKLLEQGKKQETIRVCKNPKFISLKDFSRRGNDKFNTEVSYDKERPTLIVQSSGTTGLAKSIIHTDYSINSSIYNLSYSDLPFYKGNVLLDTVPPWIAYGLVNSLYLALAFGMKVELSPKVDRDTVYEQLGNFDLCFAAPLHYRYIAENIGHIDKKSLERIKCLITGGDQISTKELEEIEGLLGKSIYNGYGCNEVLGAATVNPYNDNRHGTVGVPLCNNTIAAFDLETNEELPFNEPGEICIRTETMFDGYFNNPEETNNVKRVHEDGSSWLHTGDMGYIDEDGYVYLSGRLKRVIIKEAFKIFPGTIEKVIALHPAVKECVTVGVVDEKSGHVPMAHIQLHEEYKESMGKIEDEIKDLCLSGLKDYEIPEYFNFIDAIPYTSNNKQDYRALEDIGNEIVANSKNSSKQLVK